MSLDPDVVGLRGDYPRGCNGNGGRNGVFLELLAGLPEWVFIGGEYQDYDGVSDDGTLRLSLEVPALDIVKFSAFYYRVNIAGADDFFELDDKSAVVAQAVVPLYSFLSINLRWWRVWQADPSGNDGYKSVDVWSISAGFNFEI